MADGLAADAEPTGDDADADAPALTETRSAHGTADDGLEVVGTTEGVTWLPPGAGMSAGTSAWTVGSDAVIGSKCAGERTSKSTTPTPQSAVARPATSANHVHLPREVGLVLELSPPLVMSGGRTCVGASSVVVKADTVARCTLGGSTTALRPRMEPTMAASSALPAAPNGASAWASSTNVG